MTELNELAAALNAFEAELVTVGKKSNNPFFKSKYAELADIMLEAQPVLTKHGLAVSQLPDNIDGRPALTTILMHTSGQHISATIPLLLTKDDPQGVGSSITYMRRYGYAAALQIVIDEDDDGNRASRPAPSVSRPSAPSQPVRVPATTMQRNTINTWLDKHGVADEEKQSYLIKNFKATMPLSKDGAAAIIDKMVLGE